VGRATGGSGRGRDGLGFAFAPKREAAGKNLVSNFVARSEGEGIRANAQRIRATWVVDHLQSGTPVLNLMELAGVRSLARSLHFRVTCSSLVSRPRTSFGRPRVSTSTASVSPVCSELVG